MDLDSVQKKTVSTVSDRCWFPVPDFQDDCMMTFVISAEISFCLYVSLMHGHAISRKLRMFGWFLSLYGKYKKVWDFGSNNG